MRLEIKQGSHSLLLVVHFEGKPRDNFDKDDFSWAPTWDEINLIARSLGIFSAAKKKA